MSGSKRGDCGTLHVSLLFEPQSQNITDNVHLDTLCVNHSDNKLVLLYFDTNIFWSELTKNTKKNRMQYNEVFGLSFFFY